MNGNYTVNSVTFNAGAGAFTLSSSGGGTQTLTLGAGGITNASSNLQTVAFEAITLSAAQAWTVNGTGALTVSAPITNGGNTLTLSNGINGTGIGTISGVISGNGGITKTGSGTWVLSAANTYTGNTTVNGGILRAQGNAGALGAGTLTLTSGELQLANSSGLSFNRNTTVNGNVIITSDRLSTSTGAGVTHTLGTLSIGAQTLTVGAGSFVTSGTAGITFGAVTLTGNATFNTSNGAQLTLGAIGSGTGASRIITFDGAGNTTVSGVINNAGGAGNSTALVKNGTGTLILSASNTFTGGLSIGGGTVQLGNAGALNSTTPNAVSVATGANLQLNNNSVAIAGLSGGGNVYGRTTGNTATTLTINKTSGSDTFSGVISNNSGTGSGALSLIKNGAGTQVLSGPNTYTGTTTVNAGVLSISNSSALGQANGTAAAPGTIVNNGATLELSGGNLVIGAEALQIIGTGVGGNGALVSNGNNSWAGSITVGATANANNVVNNKITSNSGTLTLTGTITEGDANSNSKNLVVGGAGDVTITGQITHTGQGPMGIVKEDAGKLTLSGTVGNPGAGISVNGGTLAVTTNYSTFGAVTVASGARLEGSGTVGATTVSGTLASGLDFSNNLAFTTGSVFEWSLNPNGTVTDPTLVAGDVSGTGAIFKILLASTSDPYWNTDRTWTLNSIFGDTSTTLASIFTGGLDTSFAAVNGGRGFSFSGGNLVWAAIPEPTSALAGVLLGAGLFHRRRRALA